MRSLFIYLKNYKKETILAPLFKMLEASFELLVPLVMAAVIDKGIAQKDSPYIIRMCLVLIVLGIVGLICSLTAQYFSAKAAAGFGTGLRHALFEHIQHFGFSEMDEIGSSTLVTRMTSDVNQAQAGVNLVLRSFFTFAFYCIRRNGNVFYGRCQSGNGFCCCNSSFVGSCIWDHADYNASL